MKHSVTAHADHIAKLKCAKKPLIAIAELIWNALDASAKRVDVHLHPSPVGGIEAVEVVDNGCGMTPERAVQAFSGLGGSWKRLATRTEHENRVIHGKEGRGRFRALGLGRVAEWHVCYPRDKSGLAVFTVRILDETADHFVIEPDQPAAAPPGVLYQADDLQLTVWVKTWGQIFEEASARMRFFEERLGYTPDHDASLQHLKDTYVQHVGELFAKAESQQADAGGDQQSS